MACCICDRAGHDEELHGEEGAEILRLRERVLTLERAMNAALAHWGKVRPDVVQKALRRALEAEEDQ